MVILSYLLIGLTVLSAFIYLTLYIRKRMIGKSVCDDCPLKDVCNNKDDSCTDS